MKELSRLVSSIPPSETLAVSDKAKALKAAGHDVVALAGGDPDFDTPDYITAAAFQAIENGATHYPAPMKGITPLLEAIAHKMETDNGVKLNPGSDIVVTPGGKWSIFLALSAIPNPGDEVLYLEPVWVSYPPMITLAGGKPVAVTLPAGDNFRITADLLRAKITSHTKAIMINTPNNPTGRVLTREELDAIVEVVLENDLYTMTINGLSKSHAMTGWRLGWLAGPAPILKLAAQMNGQTVSSAANFTMHAAVAALKGPKDTTLAMTEAYRKRRDFMVPALNAIDGVECMNIEGAFYLFPRFPNSTKNSAELAEALIEKAGIASVPGGAFGKSGEGHVRFTIATAMKDLEKAVDKLAKAAREL